MEPVRYRIIGKSKQMRSVFISQGFHKYVQKPIKRGIEFELTPAQMSPHVRRQEAHGILKVVPIYSEEKVAEPVVVETPPVVVEEVVEVEEEVQEPKRRGRKPKMVPPELIEETSIGIFEDV